MIQLSKKQIEYTQKANHRWNIKSGAVRSGKSFVDIANVIPERIISRKDKSGLVVIAGVSRDTVERNVLQPMREIYTAKRVSPINVSKNTATLFGQEVYCLGAEKINQVAKIQGASIKYCYGDEIAKWNKEFFEMLKSRMDKPYSCFDGACNPEFPTHWLKEFLDSDADIYLQHYRIFDNPYLDPGFVENLCKEYDGTIYYDRYIEGLWKRAEGAIYRKFADAPDRFKVVPDIGKISKIVVGVDFGGNSSGHAFVATGFIGYGKVIPLMSRRIMQKDYPEPIDSSTLDKLVCEFVGAIEEKYGKVDELYWDNAETVLGNTIRNAVEKHFTHVIVRPAKKIRIKDRIDCTVRLMGAGRFFITEDCESLSGAFQEAVWDSKTDERLDDGSSDIDSLDAFEYTIERDIRYLIE
ncbi:PBSX family phage terminase large subunit [Lentihominibacter hominis]|uniref:PBSX family phage terminase large subunit n=1 Tax=Lentihominibacter hominis TaxID=2763645 RepID=UPI001A9BD056|nr:PBSX family phage terminase large subunit [Lentihominibacter hominis]